MVEIRLVRTIGCIEEEYGRIRFDGHKVCYDGLSSIFVKYLERGVKGNDQKCYMPKHGKQFLMNLKEHLAESNSSLQAIEIQSPSSLR